MGLRGQVEFSWWTVLCSGVLGTSTYRELSKLESESHARVLLSLK